MDAINQYEIEVLEMLSGDREGDGEWGAWVGACLEFLSGAGLCTKGPAFQITPKGREELARHHSASAPPR
jgi:hypothetical protein